jgi:hypothetical protein
MQLNAVTHIIIVGFALFNNQTRMKPAFIGFLFEVSVLVSLVQLAVLNYDAIHAADAPLSFKNEVIEPKISAQFHPFWRQMVTWPSNDKIKSSQADMADPKVGRAIESTKQWLTNILQTKWLGDLKGIEIIALHDDVDGNDTVRFSFKSENKLIRGAATSASIVIGIADANTNIATRTIDEKKGKDIAAARIDEYLNHAKEIKNTSLRKVQVHHGSLIGEPDVNPLTSEQWFGLVSWWTDGTRILFATGKADGGPLMPTLYKDWFSR